MEAWEAPSGSRWRMFHVRCILFWLAIFSQAHKPFIAASVAVALLAGLPMKRTGRVWKLLTEEVSNLKKLDSLLGKDWYIRRHSNGHWTMVENMQELELKYSLVNRRLMARYSYGLFDGQPGQVGVRRVNGVPRMLSSSPCSFGLVHCMQQVASCRTCQCFWAYRCCWAFHCCCS
jgi:hypothetical protein